MDISEPEPSLAPSRGAPEPPAGRRTLALFTATTFLSAALLFSVQPMFAKMVLPVLGGSTSVWAVALCFFQGALLAGYCYAHVLIRFLPPAATGLTHVVLYLCALVLLPIAVPGSWAEPPPGEPYLWQLGLFTVALGLPFVLVAANAPLLQAWFGTTGHSQARDPYFLYAASNLGSFCALLGYPFLLEPWLGLGTMSIGWSWGFVLLAAALGLCFLQVTRHMGRPGQEDGPALVAIDKPGWRERFGWTGLAFVPAALLTAFTTHVTTDVASAPLLWVVPLALYLLTFVLVFRERAIVPPQVVLAIHLAAVFVAMLQMTQTKHDGWITISTIGLAVFFLSAMVAHRTLYEARPPVAYLTQFYLFVSLGGVLGGLFAALVAPRLFSEVFEYPLLVALTMACRPGVFWLGSWRELALFAGTLVIGLALVWFGPDVATSLGWTFGGWGPTPGIALILGTLMLAAWFFPKSQLALAFAMFLCVVLLPSSVHQGEARRSYFGVYRVTLSDDEMYNVLTHGTTLHGAQRVNDDEGNSIADTTPGTYYHPESPMAKSVEIVREGLASRYATGRYGVIGLGAGSLACLSKDGEPWRFFEIDPLVIDIATQSGYFTYVRNCQPKADIVVGDARLKLAKEEDESFDLIMVDAFTSDAIPVHLMTIEALQLYLRKLKPGGIAVLHISNRYLDLDNVLSSTLGLLPGADGLLLSDDTSDGSYGSTTSTVAVFAKNKEPLAPFRELDIALEFEKSRLRAWSDDHSDILGPFLSKMRN